MKPIRSITLITATATVALPARAVTLEAVGQKAFGLACLPPAWTLPFVAVSADLLATYRSSANSDRPGIIGLWSRRVQDAAAHIGLQPHESIIVRSSAISESLDERGRYYSTSGTLREIGSALETCLGRLARDEDLGIAEVHLIVQRQITPISAKGHLSNERRCYEEARDWLGEFEDPEHEQSQVFQVNLRRWRREDRAATEAQPLSCLLKALVPRVLFAPAWWGYRQRLRLNFEWVWDGRQVVIVQADEAKPILGADPTSDPLLKRRRLRHHEPRCLERITPEHAAKYNKVRNVLTYVNLGLPTTDLFVLDDSSVLDTVLHGTPPESLLQDLTSLVQDSLVIRTDIATDDEERRQLLPRTNELRDVDAAIRFMRETLNALRSGGATEQVAFIFHNFIPAVASAFAYAAPGQRKVRIEALWGLPEGLYYNSHDKFEVDTGAKDIASIHADGRRPFKMTQRPRFKRYFVAPDANGNWITKDVAQPWDWRVCIRKRTWINEIALQSRRIAESEHRAVSVMWFIEVPPSVSKQPIFPWYHEQFDYERVRPASASRRKTPFDRTCIIRTRADIESLRREGATIGSRVRQIRIQPREEPLLRDKHALRTIGELARQINAVILLEGGTLSHAYYQLMQTKAIVEVANPFDIAEETHEFNKLVRDGIPARISTGGELVRVRKLTGDLLLRALKEKLVEEAVEALDARERDTIVEELADVEEVIDAILSQLKTKRRLVQRRKQAKRSRAGGFEQGYILVDTSNPPPVQEESGATTLPLSLEMDDTTQTSVRHIGGSISPPILATWGDRRDHLSASEHLLRLVVSLVREPWSVDSREIPLGGDGDQVLRARVRGKRVGPTLHLELSVFIPARQLKLLE